MLDQTTTTISVTLPANRVQQKKEKARASSFLRHVHYFRGIAILNIVLAHTLIVPKQFTGTAQSKWMNILSEVLFHDSTLYFLFISGFLFFHLSSRFELKKYYKGKFLNVLLPYILISSILALVQFGPQLLNNELTPALFMRRCVGSLIFGRMQTQFWYIPFIAVVFLISPLFLKIPEKYFKHLFIIAILLPLLGTRTGVEISIFQFIYFLPVYFIGVYAAKNYNAFINFINRHFGEFLSAAVVATIYLVYIQAEPSQINSYINITESVFYIQKMSFCLVIFRLLHQFKERKSTVLDKFATYSFAIYFLHKLLDITAVREKIYELFSWEYITATIVYSAVLCFATLGISMLIKAILKNSSRYLIGV